LPFKNFDLPKVGLDLPKVDLKGLLGLHKLLISSCYFRPCFPTKNVDRQNQFDIQFEWKIKGLAYH